MPAGAKGVADDDAIIVCMSDVAPPPPIHLREPARDTAVIAETEVLVLGGGPAGIAAAASAAACGRQTLLVERYGFLGGMGTAAGVTNFCGLHANVHGDIRRVVHGIADELLERIAALDMSIITTPAPKLCSAIPFPRP
jgi:NADPH-dependent 2,4-dienoyl-CoA reductase/sulfur reductase-like enzyme